ncbi:MAG: hypothetical protein EXQ55_09720 [Acidobacteria bacterium]|nr:hypothetical protein [Acidobacteriota bacterium]
MPGVRLESWKFVPSPPVVNTTVPRLAAVAAGRVMRSVADLTGIEEQVTIRLLQVLPAGGPG